MVEWDLEIHPGTPNAEIVYGTGQDNGTLAVISAFAFLAGVRTELKADIHLLERGLKIWFGKMMAWQLTAITALLAIATAAIKLL